MSRPVLAVHGLRFAYPGGDEVLDGVNLEIGAGERVAILGPNGSGKTTFLLHLNGILQGEGSVEVSGLAMREDTLPEIRRRVGFVFQDSDDQLFMPTVGQDVGFGPANLGVTEPELTEQVNRALRLVGMDGARDRAPHHLSGGERRRVALAGVLAMDPDILALDEPTSNLDPAGRRELAQVLASIDATQILVTHDLPYALELCPRSVVFDGGRVVADGRTRDLLLDARLLAAHRLELPLGFDPGSVRSVG